MCSSAPWGQANSTDSGVSVVAGEVEHRWADLLRNAYYGKLKPVYRFLDDPPDLSVAPRPVKHKQFTAKRDLAKFWIAAGRQFRNGRIGILLQIDRIALNGLREIRLSAGFLTALITGQSQ